MVFEYETSKYVKETKRIEISDTKNVFLKGKNILDNLPTYFGIWINNGGISIVTIISYRNINYKYYLNTNLDTEYDIKEYVKFSEHIETISKDEFKEKIDIIKGIMEI